MAERRFAVERSATDRIVRATWALVERAFGHVKFRSGQLNWV